MGTVRDRRTSAASVLAASGHAMETLEPRMLMFGFVGTDIPDVVGDMVQFADFDGDGDQDLASWDTGTGAPSGGGPVRIWSNDGTGSFGAAGSLVSSTGQSLDLPLVVGDFDGDGDIDVLAGATLHRNAGNATFTAVALSGLSAVSRNAKVANVDGDAQREIVATTADSIVIIHFTTSGDIASTQSVPSTTLGGPLAVGDIDNDGDADIVAAVPGSIQRLRNDAGTFVPLAGLSATNAPGIIADLDVDGALDYAYSSNSDLFVAWGDRAGGFAAPVEVLSDIVVSPGSAGFGLLARTAEFNRDGRPDLLVFTSSDGNTRVVASVLSSGTRGFVDDLVPVTTLGIFDFLGDGKNAVDAADINADGRTDVLFARISPSQPSDGISDSRITLNAIGPSVATLSAPVRPIVPGETFTFRAAGFSAPVGRVVQSVRLYLDSNANGTFDSTTDQLLTISSLSDDDGFFSLAASLDDTFRPGTYRFFAVAADTQGIFGNAVSTEASAWLRAFYPDGFRENRRIAESLTIANPNRSRANYRIVARYESGAEQVISEGSLRARRSATFTLSSATVGQSVVPLGRAYTIEVQSDKVLGGTYARSERVKNNRGGALVGESIGNYLADEWAFGGLSSGGSTRVALYNPLSEDILVRLDSTGNGSLISREIAIPGLKTARFNLHEDSAFNDNQVYKLIAISSDPFSLAVTQFDSRRRTGDTAWGSRSVEDELNIPIVPLGSGIDNKLRITPFDDDTLIASVRVRYFGVDASDSVRSVNVPVDGTVVDLDDNAPAGATGASILVRASERILVNLDTTNSQVGDEASPAAQAIVGTQESTRWVFAGSLLDPDNLGTTEQLRLGLFNAGGSSRTITMRFLFEGSATSRTITVAPGDTVFVNLHEESRITSRLDAAGVARTNFGIALTSGRGFFAGLTAVDGTRFGAISTIGVDWA